MFLPTSPRSIPLPGREKRLEQRRGGLGVPAGLSLRVGEPGAGPGAVGEGVVGGGGAETFVVEVDDEAGSCAQSIGERTSERCAWAFGAVHVERQADHKLDVRGSDMLVSGGDDGLDEIVSVAAIERDLDGLGGRADAGLVVTDAESCSFVTKVDREEPHG